MAPLSARDITLAALWTLMATLLCLGSLPGAQAKYDVSMFRTYFGCPPCDKAQCKIPQGCELVEGPGVCSCCMTCAREEGDPCGISTEKCGAGLRCNPPDNSILGFEMLMEGRGRCEPIEAFPGFSPMIKRVERLRAARARRGQFGFP